MAETLCVPNLKYKLLDNDRLVIAPGEEKKPFYIIKGKDREVLIFYLFPTRKFGYTFQKDIWVCPTKYFIQKLLTYFQILHQIAIIFLYTICLAVNEFKQQLEHTDAESKMQ